MAPTIQGAAALAAMLLVLAACDENGDGATEIAHEWPANQREAFMENCQEGLGGSESLCRCLLGMARIRFTAHAWDEIDDRLHVYGHDDDFEDFLDKQGAVCAVAAGG